MRTNIATGQVVQNQVAETFVLESDHIDYLTIIDANGNEQTIETTDSHPFWVVTDDPDLDRAAREYVDGFYHENVTPGLNGYWVEARDLRVGDVFLGANGELSTLVDYERIEFPEGVKVYNFVVEGNHDYFVIAKTGDFGQTCVLVHNANRCSGKNPPIDRPNQQKHIDGTPTKSQFKPGLDVDDLVRDTWKNGKIVIGKDGRLYKMKTYIQTIGMNIYQKTIKAVFKRGKGIHGYPSARPEPPRDFWDVGKDGWW